MLIKTLTALLLLTFTARAAVAGTQKNNSPADLPPEPASPVPFLSAADAIRTFNLAPGFRAEVVAAEPMIQHPIAVSFDADGRMWVVEMRTYMPDIDAHGENTPGCRISILEDTDGDGRMDKYTVFLDHLVLPRAVSCVRGGALVAVPPKVLFCRDTNGDGTCDEQTVVATDYGLVGNVEHQPNGLLPALDNWIYNANYGGRFRYISGAWTAQPVPEMGQWGIAQDNFGRLFFNYNSDYLRASVIPPSYGDRNPHYRTGTVANWPVDRDQTVWPAHGTALNRGYLPNFRRADGTLRKFTAACAPLIYRGGVFPKEFDGNAFVCEPSANVIRRSIVNETPDGALTAHNAYDRREFIASTYERFRPVNLSLGPDGAIYVIDIAHGLLQHEAYETDYVKDQYRQRQLDKYLGAGRIYRIVPEKSRLFPRPHLSNKTTPQLVDQLAHPNGWWRDTAQRLLAERGDYKAIPLLRKAATKSDNPLCRLHALWTLEGFRITDPAVLLPALADENSKIRAAAIRLAEPLLSTPARNKVLPAIMKLAGDSSGDVRLQFALTAGGIGTPESETALLDLLRRSPEQLPLRDAILGGLRGRELEFLQRLLDSPQWGDRTPPRAEVLNALAACVLDERSPKRVAKLVDVMAKQPPQEIWRQDALLSAFPQTGTNRRAPKPILLDAPPTALLALQPTTRTTLTTAAASPPATATSSASANNHAASPASSRPTAAPLDPIAPRSDPDANTGSPSHPTTTASTHSAEGRFDRVYALVHWPGEPGYVPPPPPPPLTPQQQALFERGRQVYGMTCIQCHKATGQGQEGLAPPLLDSEWALGPHERIVRIVLNGLQGPINVNGRTYSLEMPSLAALKDDDIAAVLTYVRRAWEHDASPVDPKAVKEIRETVARKQPWTERELLKVK